jgi:hypothetical protein
MPTLVRDLRAVFSNRAISAERPARPRLDEAEGDVIGGGWRRGGAPVSGRRNADAPGEGGREGPDALEAHGEADSRDAVFGCAQQVLGALQPPAQQVLVRRLPEDPSKAAAEVARGDVRLARERLQVERLVVSPIDQVTSAKEVPFERHCGHGRMISCRDKIALVHSERDERDSPA